MTEAVDGDVSTKRTPAGLCSNASLPGFEFGEVTSSHAITGAPDGPGRAHSNEVAPTELTALGTTHASTGLDTGSAQKIGSCASQRALHKTGRKPFGHRCHALMQRFPAR